MNKKKKKNPQGAVALTAMIVITSLLLIFGISLILTSIDIAKSSNNFETNLLAMVRSRACVEEGLYNLRKNPAYTGTLSITFTDGTCDVGIAIHTGNSDYRALQITSIVGEYTTNDTVYVNVTTDPYIVTVIDPENGGGGVITIPGLVAQWKFNEGSGLIALDNSGNNYDLTIQEAGWSTAGQEGFALNFDGKDDYIDRSSAPWFTDDFTLIGWVNLSTIDRQNPIFSKTNNSNHDVTFSVASDNRLQFDVYKNQSSSTSLKSTSTLTANTWYQVAATYDFASDGTSELRIYINGSEDSVTTTGVGPPADAGQALEIGRYTYDGISIDYADGLFDDLRIYDKELTGSEVSNLYNEDDIPITSFTASVVAGVAPLEVDFMDQSLNSPAAWSWDFDNDLIEDETTQDATHIYTAPGTYSVSLTASNGFGGTKLTKSNYVIVNSLEGILMRLQMNENSGSVANDTSGNFNHANISVPGWATGHEGSGVEFDGADTAITRGNSQWFSDDFTISSWINVDNSGSAMYPIVTKEGNNNRGVTFYVNNSGYLVGQVFKDQAANTLVTSSSPVGFDSWHHVAMTYDYVDDGTSELLLYVDGFEVGSSTTAVGPPIVNGNALGIGYYKWAVYLIEFMDGTMDDVRVYDRELSASEISTINSE